MESELATPLPREASFARGALPEDTRARLIVVAKDLFSRRGYSGTTVKDLAEAAQVNISLVSYHFGGKEALFIACLESMAQGRLELSQKLLQPAATVGEFKLRLEMFIEALTDYHSDEPAACSLVHSSHDVEMDFVQPVFENGFFKVYKTYLAYLEDAQKRGFIRTSLDVPIIGGILLGSIIHAFQKDRLAKKYFNRTLSDPKYRKLFVRNLIDCFFEGSLA